MAINRRAGVEGIVGWVANFALIGNLHPVGIAPFKLVMAASASDLRLNRTKATPLESPIIEINA